MARTRKSEAVLDTDRGHRELLDKHEQRLEGLLDLQATHEQFNPIGNADEIKRLAVEIRLLRQRIAYMGGEDTRPATTKGQTE
jgi:hypothetical protein